MSGWAETSRAVLNRVNDQLPEGVSLADRIKAVDAAYPFGERAYWPYKAWLKARKAYLTRYGYKTKKDAGPLFPNLPRDPISGRPVI